eukprot:5275971-Prymnesium_polylepis.1
MRPRQRPRGSAPPTAPTGLRVWQHCTPRGRIRPPHASSAAAALKRPPHASNAFGSLPTTAAQHAVRASEARRRTAFSAAAYCSTSWVRRASFWAQKALSLRTRWSASSLAD